MAKDINDINNYKLGYYKGLQAAKEGKSEAEVVALETNQDLIEGIHDGFTMHLHIVFADSVKNLREAISSNSKIEDSVSKMQIARSNYMQRIYDSDFTLRKERPDMYSVDKDGKHCYTLFKGKGGKWSCSCAGYSFRHKCKHVDAINELLNNSTQRLPQHLARVRALEKSLKIWKERLEANPNDKTAKKNVEVRTKALEEAKKKADEIEAMPKPQRRNREEFEGVLPQLDKLFEGLGDYTIVGSWRRGKDTYKDCDILTVMSPANWSKLKERLQNDENFGPAPGHTHADFGDEVVRGGYKNGDVVEYLDINRVPNPDEWGCFVGGTKVLTPEGYKSIEEITPGSVVFSGTGFPTKVICVREKLVDSLVEFKGRNRMICCTPNHRIKVAGYGGRVYSSPVWVPAVDLKYNALLCYPTLHFNEVVSDITPAQAFIIGLYLADGCLGFNYRNGRIEEPHNIQISLHKNHLNDYMTLLEGMGVPIHRSNVDSGSRRGNECTIYITDKNLVSLCKEYAGYTHAATKKSKKFDPRIYNWPRELKREYLRGFFLGDGSFHHSSVTWMNTNREVIEGISLILKEFGPAFGVREITVKEGKLAMFETGAASSEATVLLDNLNLRSLLRMKDAKAEEKVSVLRIVDGTYYKIKRGKSPVEIRNTCKVYDIQTESSDFLIEDGFIVHNSWLIFRTGSAQFNIAMRGWLKRFGCGLNERGLIGPNGEIVASKTEEDIFNAIGIPYIDPKDRETPQKFYQEVKKLDKPKFL